MPEQENVKRLIRSWIYDLLSDLEMREVDTDKCVRSELDNGKEVVIDIFFLR